MNGLYIPGGVSEARKRIEAAGRAYGRQHDAVRRRAAADRPKANAVERGKLVAQRRRQLLAAKRAREAEMAEAAYLAEKAYRESQSPDLAIARSLRLQEIVLLVTARTGVSRDEIMSIRRNRRVVAARHECFWMAHKHTSQSYPQIGRFFGGRDHSTVMHGVRMHESRMVAV